MTDELVTAVRDLPNVEFAEAPFDDDDREQTLTVTLTGDRTASAVVPDGLVGRWVFTVDGKKQPVTDDPVAFLGGLG